MSYAPRNPISVSFIISVFLLCCSDHFCNRNCNTWLFSNYKFHLYFSSCFQYKRAKDFTHSPCILHQILYGFRYKLILPHNLLYLLFLLHLLHFRFLPPLKRNHHLPPQSLQAPYLPFS